MAKSTDDQERIDALFVMYCETILTKVEAHDYIKRHKKDMDDRTIEFFEMVLVERRASQKTLEKVAKDLFGVDLWHMWLNPEQKKTGQD